VFNKKAIFWNTASQVIVRFITLAFTLISIKLLANYLGPEGVGNYNTITTYVNFFIVIADLGLFAVTVREIAKNPDSEPRIISNVFTLRFFSALFASVIAVIIVFLTNYSSDIKLGVLIATGFLFFNLLGSVYDMVLQYRLKMQYSALAEFLSKVIAIIALYIIIITHGSFLAIMSTVAITGIGIFVFKWLFARTFIEFGPKYDKKIASWIFNAAWPLGLVFIINNLYFKLDTLLLFVIKGATAVGIYSVSYKILEVTAFIGSYFASALKPAISEKITTDKQAVASIIRKSISVMVFISMPLLIVSIVFSKDIILFLSTKDFLAGSNALIFLSITLPLIYLDTLLIEILIANDERKTLIKIAGFILLFNLVANLIFIPLFSYMGAAFTTLLSELILLLINLHYTRKIVKYKIDYPVLFKITIISISTFTIAMTSKQTDINFLILIMISIVVYLVLASWLKIIKLASVKDLLDKN